MVDSEYKGKVYQASVVIDACGEGMTARKLGYWIATGVVYPSKAYRRNKEGRDLFLYSFEDIVCISIVHSLREAGVSLQEVRQAIKYLRAREPRSWHRVWLVTDGKRVYKKLSNDELESLSKKSPGQLVFSVITLGEAQSKMIKELQKSGVAPFDGSRYKGRIREYQPRKYLSGTG